MDNIERVIKHFCVGTKSAVKTSAELDQRIMDDAVLARREPKMTQSAAVQPDVRRITMRTTMAKYAVVAAITGAAVIGIIEIGTPTGGANALFAAAMDSIRQAGTFSCTEIRESSYEDGEVGGTFLLRQRWMFREPDRERHEWLTSPWAESIGEVTITDYGTRKRLVLRPVERTAQLLDLSSEYDVDHRTGGLELTGLNTRLRDYLVELSTGAVEDLGTVKLDGRSVRLLRSRRDSCIATAWINPETTYPVQMELKWTDQSRAPTMFTSIQIDVELADDLFSLEPPEGYTLGVDKPDESDDNQKMMAKMKHLGLWCINYASDNDNRFPDDLEDLVTANIVTGEALGKVLAAPDDADGPPVIRYRKPNIDVKHRSAEVILYEVYEQWPEDGIVACFADGHCELIVNQERFEGLIGLE